MTKAPQVQCPGGELTRGTLSSNDHDVRCHVSGALRAAEGSPCCGEYIKCAIWRQNREREWAAKPRKNPVKYIHAGGG